MRHRMPRIIRTHQAEADLEEIWEYIAKDNVSAANEFASRIDAAFRELAAAPRIGAPRDELRNNLRSFPIGRFLIFYDADDRGIRVIRVLHGARLYEKLL